MTERSTCCAVRTVRPGVARGRGARRSPRGRGRSPRAFARHASRRLSVGQVAVLGLAGLQGRDLHRAAPRRPRRRRRGSRRGGSRRRAAPRRSKPLDVGDAVVDRLPLDAEPPGQLVAQVGLVDVAGGLRVLVDRRVVEPRPAAVRPLGRVGDRGRGCGAGGRRRARSGGRRRRRGSRCRGRTRGRRCRAGSSRPGAPCSRGRRRRRRGGPPSTSAGDRMAAERPGQRDRLRRREGEIEAGDRLAARRRLQAERLAGRPGCGRSASRRAGRARPCRRGRARAAAWPSQ